MLLLRYFLLSIPATSLAANIVLGNDGLKAQTRETWSVLTYNGRALDGWAEINIRTFYDTLTAAGESVIISAPAENQSGKGGLDVPPTKLNEPCEFNSCPTGSPPVGNNASMPRFNYVNSYPVPAIHYGINTLSPTYFGGRPDLAVTGFNVGSNLGVAVLVSGTENAAISASSDGIPSIAFSGSTGSQTAWNAPPEAYEHLYADLSTNVTQALLDSGAPYLPKSVWLNVNFPAVSPGKCDNVADYHFVLSRIWTAIPFATPADVTTCNNKGRLPTENSVVDTTSGCYASISVGNGHVDANAASQQTVLNKLSKLLSCLP